MLLYIPQLVERPKVVIASPVRPKASDDRDDLRCDAAAYPFDVAFETIRIVAEGKCGVQVSAPQGGLAGVHGMIQSGAKSAGNLFYRHWPLWRQRRLELDPMDVHALFEIEARNIKVGGSGKKLPHCCVQALSFIPPIC